MPNETGYFGEKLACNFLKEQGFKILFQNIHCLYGEIDILAYKDNTLHFVEVKTRKSVKFGFPVESYTASKREKIVKAAFWIMHESGLLLPVFTRFQFDFIGWLLDKENNVLHQDWIENAWD